MGNRRCFPLVLLLSFTLVSCSIVKEDRSACPCYLTVEMTGLPAHPATLSIAGAGICEVERDTVLLVAVPRTGVEVVAVSGASPDAEGAVRIPYGFDCPSLYLFSEEVDTARDTARVKVVMHKQFCTLRLEFDGPPGWGEPYWAQVRGKVEGMDGEGKPLPGAFDCRLDVGGAVRLPRQEPEEELWLDVTMPDKVVRSFALGSYMLKAGYDWTAPDLDDLGLVINLSVSEIRFTSGNWTTVVSLKVDI